MNRTLLSTVILCLPLLATAQTVWRCGPEGRSFSDQPCSEGRQMALAVDPRPADDVHTARLQAARDIRLAETMRRERLRQEALLRGSGLASLGPQDVDRLKAEKAAPRLRQKATKPHPPALRTAARGTWPAVAQLSRRTPD